MASPRTLPEQIGALVDERLLQLLSQAFPAPRPRPGISQDTLMYEGGRASVVEYLQECLKQARVL